MIFSPCRNFSAIATCLAAFLFSTATGAEVADFLNPVHGYMTRPPQDRFTRLKAELDAGRTVLDTGSERAFLLSLLGALEVPVPSQLLAYSAISLQSRRISPSNPRAILFHDDTYVAWVPGGQIEIASLDPDLGCIFYLLDPAKAGQRPQAARSDRCMNCHAGPSTHRVPGLVVESVVPSITGGGVSAFRREQSGHGIPLDLRLGGWHVTGAGAFTKHHGNVVLEFPNTVRTERVLKPGELFDIARYPVTTSDLLPHLLHEHQVGAVNRLVEATYLARACLDGKPAPAPDAPAPELDTLARNVVRYLLFADEVALPPAGVTGDPAFKAAFLTTRKPAASGASLRDLDLRTRLLRHRCSYMIYSPAFTGLPAPLKQRVYRQLDRALSEPSPEAEYAYLPAAEKRAIRAILRETLPELAATWRR